MKFSTAIQIRSRALVSAFTLVEIMVASFIFVSFVVGGMVAMQIFGIRNYQLSATKLMSSADSVKVLANIRDQIRGAASVQVGTMSSTNPAGFLAITNGMNQVGNALQVFPIGTNFTSYTIFYMDAPTTNLYYISTTNDTQTATAANPGVLLARWVVNNTNCFQAEDFAGNILTNNQNNCTIHVALQFWEQEYSFQKYSTNFYLLETRVTPRSPDLSATIY
ncbi:MAG: hypothetical protein ABSG87_00320 [Verrucomicrobiota bacterium]|jgi:hypothetical protein